MTPTDTVGSSWLCRCTYTNVPSLRCYLCGAWPPRRLRVAMRAEESPVSCDA